MQLQNKNRIAYLGALTLLFSYAEMMLPRILPFFRLGFGNIAILLALDLDLPSFLILTVIKSVASSLMSGTLFSPFFLISITQSIISGLVMYLFFKIKGKWLSIYGISLIGSALSTVIQLLLATLYLGKETMRLLGPMLLFSVAAALVTAFCSIALKIPETAPEISESDYVEKPKKSLILIILILCATVATFMINNVWILLGALVLAFVFQIISGRKLLIIPHLSIWIFVILISIFSPSGKILFKIGSFSITKGALILGITKSLKLSIAAALSQCAAALRPSKNSLLGLTLSYFRALSDKFRNTQGNLLQRLQSTVSAETL